MLVELAGTASLLLVVLLSGSQQVQLGKGTLTDAVVGSVSLGLGFALVLWTFGRYTLGPTEEYREVANTARTNVATSRFEAK